jgi:probable F420-dependent oxidoreductase
MGAGTLAQLSRDRFVLGLGASSHAIIGDWNGIDFEAPLGHVKESVAILRQALAGERTDHAGEHFRSKGFRLTSPPGKPLRIYLAALREKMLRLAGAIGEGLIINFQPASAMPQILAAYRAGAAAAGRDATRDEVVSRFQVCLTEDRAKARGLVRLGFGAYLATPVYNAYLAWCGFPEEARAIREGFAKRDRKAVAAAIPDDLVDRIAILGTADECRAQLAEFVKAGVTTPVLAPLATSPAEAERIYATFAPARGG